MLIASFLVFAIVEFTPGSVARKILGPYATDEQIEILSHKMTLNDPLLVRYGRWFGVLVGAIDDPIADPALGLGYVDSRGSRYFGNFGFSAMYKVPIHDILWDRLANTMMLAGIAYMFIVPLSMGLGVLAGMKEGSALDRGISIAATTLTSVPEFASAVFLSSIFVVLLGWLPGTSSLVTDEWNLVSQLVLPVLVLVMYDVGYVVRILRSSMVEVMSQPFIRTAVLKGLTPRKVVFGHALPNAIIAPFTVLMLQVPFLISGVVVTEIVFGFPGFGRLLLDTAMYGDIAMVEAVTLVALFIVAVTQLAADIGYLLLDPRIRLS